MPDRVEILSRRRIFDGFFKIEAAELRYERFDGSMTPSVERLVFERGDSVAAIIYHRQEAKLLFLRQFRYPTHEKGPGWITEIVAGMKEAGESPEISLKREILEESGYEAASVEPIATFYVSPGGSSERITLFYAEVVSTGRVASGGGLEEENEDIQTVWYTPEETARAVLTGEIQDAKTLVGIFWLQNKWLRNKIDDGKA